MPLPPGMMPPTGPAAMPPGLAARGPAAGTGAAMAPGAMMGTQAQSMILLKVAVHALQKALPGLQIGSSLQTKILKFVADVGKDMSESGGTDAAAQMQQILQLAQAARQQPQQQAQLAGMFPTQQPGMSPPGAGGPTPPGPAAQA